MAELPPNATVYPRRESVNGRLSLHAIPGYAAGKEPYATFNRHDVTEGTMTYAERTFR